MINLLYPRIYYDMAQYGGGDTGDGGGDSGNGGNGGNGDDGGNGGGGGAVVGLTNGSLTNLQLQSSSLVLTPEVLITIPAENIDVDYLPGSNIMTVDNSNDREFLYSIQFSGSNNMSFGTFKITAKDGYYFNSIINPHIKTINNSSYNIIKSNDIYNDDNQLVSRSFTIYSDKGILFNFNGTDKISFNTKPLLSAKHRKLEILDFYPVPDITNRGACPQPGDTREIAVLGVPGAKFSVKLIDSDTNYSILDTPLNDVEIPSNGKYVFNQIFPNSLSAKSYYMDIVPGLDTVINKRLNRFIDRNKDLYGVNNQFIFHQYPNVSVQFTKTTDTLLGLVSPRYTAAALSVSGTNITLTGRGSSVVDNDTTTKTNQKNAVSWTVSASTAIYINGPIRNSSWVLGPTTKEMIDGSLTTKKPTDYTKTVAQKVENSNKVFLSSTKDLVVGMYTADIPNVKKSAIGPVYYESADPYDNNKITDKIKLKSISELDCGMEVDKGTTITSIDKDDNIITISEKRIWPSGNFSIEFWYKENRSPNARIKSIDCDESITIHDRRTIQPGVKLTFTGGKDRGETVVDADLSATGSGTTSVTISGYVSVKSFGEHDTIQSLNVEDFVTDKPNVYTQQVECPKGTVESNPGIEINLIKDDTDGDVATKTVTIVHNPTQGTLAAVEGKDRSKTYTPDLGFTGTDEFVFKVANAAGKFSEEKTVYITIK